MPVVCCVMWISAGVLLKWGVSHDVGKTYLVAPGAVGMDTFRDSEEESDDTCDDG